MSKYTAWLHDGEVVVIDEDQHVLEDHPSYSQWLWATVRGQRCRVNKKHLMVVFEEDEE